MEELLKNPLKLYRDCIRLADFVAKRQGVSAEAFRSQVRMEWNKNRHETDPTRINQLREGAVRGLTNFIMHEAQMHAKKGEAFLPDEEEDEKKK